ncbi:MAG: LysM peptidoglycan-binding domain-containing protein [Gammaproteobacteria bacterium]|nr:LysM peptidoglycan-binding domain-containing protein [Gammaproteobacteria bacterium]
MVLVLIILPVTIYAIGGIHNNAIGAKYSASDQQDVTDKASLAPWVKFSNRDSATTDDQYDDLLTRTVSQRAGRSRVVSGNIWHRVRKGFALNGYEHRRVDAELKWFSRHQGYIDRITTRAMPFLYYILAEVEKRHMPAEIALLPIVESAFQPYAYSPGQAAGMWQFIAATGQRYGLEMNWWYDGRRDVYQSTHAALDFLLDLHEHFNNDWLLALAAYNSGQGTVDRAIRANQRAGKKTDFWSLQLPKETRDYVPKLLAISVLIDDPRAFGIRLSILPDRPYFEKVDIGAQIDLSLAAVMADMAVEELYSLNPAFNRWATAPDGPHYLLIPVDKAPAFKQNLAKIDLQEAIHWTQHKIEAGETLGTIAARYNTTISAIQKINKISDATIISGESLIIPVASANASNSQSSKVEHTVEQGDTFWNLAKQYDVSIKHIAEWNSMTPEDYLIPGQTLVIWQNTISPSDKLDQRLVKTRFTAPPKRSTTRKITYRVRNGESLSLISKKFRVDVDDVIQWNALEEENDLRPGQHLKLYVDVTRFSGKI